MSAVLVDTNILVYSIDGSCPARHAAVARTLVGLGRDRVLVSAQVLSEFANVMVHPRKLAMHAADAAGTVQAIVEACGVLAVDAEVVVAAISARDRWQLEYYDAQIWAAAALNDVPVVLSEDFASGATLGGVTFINPFAEDFDLGAL